MLSVQGDGVAGQGVALELLDPYLEVLERMLGPLDTEDDLQEALNLVLSNIITVEDTIVADDLDFLAGTQLDQPGQAGVYTVWIASTVGDTLLTITLGGQSITNNAVVTLRANSEIRENEDTFFQMLSVTGGRPVINVNIVTAAVVRIRVKFLPAGAM